MRPHHKEEREAIATRTYVVLTYPLALETRGYPVIPLKDCPSLPQLAFH